MFIDLFRSCSIFVHGMNYAAMGHNVSQQKRRSEVMTAPIGSFTGWSFLATCPACRDRRYISVDRLAGQYGGHHKVQSVVSRLRCSIPSCRKAPSFVRLQSREEGRDCPPIKDVVLVGPGAY